MKLMESEILVDIELEGKPGTIVELYIHCLMQGKDIVEILDSHLTGVMAFAE